MNTLFEVGLLRRNAANESLKSNFWATQIGFIDIAFSIRHTIANLKLVIFRILNPRDVLRRL